LWELCERYGLAECSGVGTVSHTIAGTGHQFHTVHQRSVHQKSPVIGVKRFDLVNGVVDGNDDVTGCERVRFNSMTSPAIRMGFSSSKVQRTGSRQATPSHSSLTGARNRPTFQTELVGDRSQKSTFVVPRSARCVGHCSVSDDDNVSNELNMTANNEGDNDKCLMPPVNASWKPPRERSPYYFKLDSDNAVTADRLPLVGGHAMTSDPDQSHAVK